MMESYQRLEVEWAEFNGLPREGMVACASGSAALHLALEALSLPQGSEVVTSDFNMIAVPRAIAMAGLRPTFVDCDERLLMNTNLKLGISSDAAIYVAIYGRRNVSNTGGVIYIVEDLAEAHGMKPTESTDVAAWSFYKNKVVAGEEGGAVWFRDREHADLARQLRSLGFTAAHDFRHTPRGHNYRMSNAHADLVLASLRNYPTNLARRREIEGYYEEFCPEEWRMPARDVPWVYDLRLPWGCNLDKVVQACHDAGIAARHSFKPMHEQEEFRECRFVHKKIGDRSNVSLAYTRVMYLPIQPAVTTRNDCRRAFEVIASVLE